MKSGRVSIPGWLRYGCVVLLLLVGYFGYQCFPSVSKAKGESTELFAGPYLNSLESEGAKLIWFSSDKDAEAVVTVKSKRWSKEFRPEIRSLSRSLGSLMLRCRLYRISRRFLICIGRRTK